MREGQSRRSGNRKRLSFRLPETRFWRHRKPRFSGICFWGARGVMQVCRPQVVSRDSACRSAADPVAGLRLPVSRSPPLADPVASLRRWPGPVAAGLRWPVSVSGELAAGNRDPADKRRRHVRLVDKPGRLGYLLAASRLPVG